MDDAKCVYIDLEKTQSIKKMNGLIVREKEKIRSLPLNLISALVCVERLPHKGGAFMKIICS